MTPSIIMMIPPMIIDMIMSGDHPGNESIADGEEISLQEIMTTFE
jgi:hypothetical protein